MTAIWDNRDRDYNVGCLVKRLQRVDKQLSAEARDLFAAYVPDGDLAKYARGLKANLSRDFTGSMKLLKDPGFQDLIVSYPRAKRTFFVAQGVEDQVSSSWMVRDSAGNEHRPTDYLAAFAEWVKQNPAQIEAIRILLSRPRDWSSNALGELREKLKTTPQRFTEENLRKAHEIKYHRALVDIISMVKHAANEEAPLLTASERVERAFQKVTVGKAFTPEQQQWLTRIQEHLRENLSLDTDDFDLIPIFMDHGGLAVVRRLFPKLNELIVELNEAVAA